MRWLTIILFIPSFSLAMPVQLFWIPEAFVMNPGRCRMDIQNQFAWEKRDSGNFYDYGFGGSCGVYADKYWDLDFAIEIGIDWRESHDRQLTSSMDSFLSHLQFNFLNLRKMGWGIGLGMHSIGFAPNVNNYNVTYLMIQNQSEFWRMGIGGYIGNPQLLINDKMQKDNNGIMAGVWRQSDRALFSVEWQSGLNRFGYLFFGGGIILPSNSRVSLGYGISNNRVTQRDWILLKVSLDFSWLSQLKTEFPFDF